MDNPQVLPAIAADVPNEDALQHQGNHTADELDEEELMLLQPQFTQCTQSQYDGEEPMPGQQDGSNMQEVAGATNADAAAQQQHPMITDSEAQDLELLAQLGPPPSLPFSQTQDVALPAGSAADDDPPQQPTITDTEAQDLELLAQLGPPPSLPFSQTQDDALPAAGLGAHQQPTITDTEAQDLELLAQLGPPPSLPFSQTQGEPSYEDDPAPGNRAHPMGVVQGTYYGDADDFDPDEYLDARQEYEQHLQGHAPPPEEDMQDRAQPQGGERAKRQLDVGGTEAAGGQQQGASKRARPATTAAAAPAGGDLPEPGMTEEEIDALFAEEEQAARAVLRTGQEEDVGQQQQGLSPRLLATDIPGEVFPVTSASGLRAYCQLVPQQEAQQLQEAGREFMLQGVAAARRALGNPAEGGQTGAAQATALNLLSKPIGQMLREVEDQRLQASLAESRRVQREAEAARMRAEMHDLLGAGLQGAAGMEVEDDQGQQQEQQQQQEASAGDSLWVNKYAPRSFMSLLSDEQTNREVARWVKAWDATVFGKPRQQEQQSAQAMAGMSKTARAVLRAKSQAAAADTRPDQRLILMCGPPGLGKTTLAHVVARHCGYHPYEINASDDRSASALTARVTDAVQMRPVLGVKRPNCVIIDEIDGATGGAEGHSAISALLRIINAGNKGDAKAGDEEVEEAGGGKKPGKKGKSHAVALSRPIIGIANDLYAPALRPLREVAKVFHFKAPDSEKLVSRLQAICSNEHVKVDKAALHALAQRTDCDIRSCLNTLQFLARQQQSSRGDSHHLPGGHVAHITLKHVTELSIGVKDSSKSVFSVWDSLLHVPKQQAVQGRSGQGGSARSRLVQLYSSLQDFGEHELVLSGVFENLHNVRFLDVHLQKMSSMLDSLAQADLLISGGRKAVDFQLLGYVPALVLAVHVAVAQPEKVHLQWPKAAGDMARGLASNQELLRTWSSTKVAARTLQGHIGRSMALEVVPALVHVLAPSIRPLALHLLSPAEHAALASTVGIMAEYGLTYSLEEEAGPAKTSWAVGKPGAGRPGAPGASAAVRPVPLQPPLDCLHRYNAAASTVAFVQRAIPLVLRQIINQQIGIVAIRKAEAASNEEQQVASSTAAIQSPTAGNHPAAPAAKQAGPKGQAGAKKVAAAPAAVAPAPKKGNWLDALRINAISRRKPAVSKPAAHVAEAVLEAEGNVAEAAQKAGTLHFPVLYKFNEGYTNSVKRPLMMQELL